MFTLEQLKIFLEIADAGSFTCVAKNRSVSQSSISQSIKSLEAKLDTPLFFRQGNAVFLTRAGEEFLVHARIINANIDRALEAVRALRSHAKR